MEIVEIKYFLKNKNKKLYNDIINKYFNDSKKCIKCNNSIYYYDSSFKISKGELLLTGKSFLSKKTIYNDYMLSICEDCLITKFPEYVNKNKSRVFNQMNYITTYAFNIPDDISSKWINENYVINESNLIKKWGYKLGSQKWENYKLKQAYSNSFEYKNIKYGWDRVKYEKYNQSRSITLDNLIKKHGESKGLIVWNSYCDKQRYSTTMEYFIKKYGSEKGIIIYDNFCRKRINGAGYSKSSKIFFDLLSSYLKNYTLYYSTNEWFSYDKLNKKYYLVDFYIKELNIAIEYNGDLWHANPKKYKPLDTNSFSE